MIFIVENIHILKNIWPSIHTGPATSLTTRTRYQNDGKKSSDCLCAFMIKFFFAGGSLCLPSPSLDFVSRCVPDGMES